MEPALGRVEVAVAAAVRGTFTYLSDDPAALVPGRRLLVPLGARRSIGFSLGAAPERPGQKLKAISELLDDGPLLTPPVLDLVRFAADYYLCPLGLALSVAVPPVLGRTSTAARPKGHDGGTLVSLAAPAEVIEAALGRGKLQRAVIEHLAARGTPVSLEELRRALPGVGPQLKALVQKALVKLHAPDAPLDPFANAVARRLTEAQAAAVAAIDGDAGSFAPRLLFGVTGSGKTEVYLAVIAAARARGEGALVLVPEIALTPQLAGRFRARFGGDVAVLHSGLADAERAREHRRLLTGEARIAVGVRSAVFAPVQELGIIVVDEEHEPSFKQEDTLRYHARDLAVVRAQRAKIPIVLGSATPSLESLRNVSEARYAISELPTRVDGRAMPDVQIVDLSAAARPAPSVVTELVQGASAAEVPPPTMLSAPLADALEATLAQGEQAILFLNRRGHASLVVCRTCGEAARCPHCDVGLTLHLGRRRLICHYCEHQRRLEESCACGGPMITFGAGTERIHEELGRRFPEARVLRLDRDVITTTAELTRTLAAFARREADFLVGTQMVAKGHDFPGVTLVGVVLADLGLALPDFRAAERTFQLLAQVAGRAGRGERPGRVIVQSLHPAQDAVASVPGHDARGFAGRELARRKAHGWPPFRRLVAIRIEAKDPGAAERAAQRLAEAAKRSREKGVEILGPSPAPMAKLRGLHRFQLVLRGDAQGSARRVARGLLEVAGTLTGGARALFDVDPASML